MTQQKQSLCKLLVPDLRVEVGTEVRIEYELCGKAIDEVVRVAAVCDGAIYFEGVDDSNQQS